MLGTPESKLCSYFPSTAFDVDEMLPVSVVNVSFWKATLIPRESMTIICDIYSFAPGGGVTLTYRVLTPFVIVYRPFVSLLNGVNVKGAIGA